MEIITQNQHQHQSHGFGGQIAPMAETASTAVAAQAKAMVEARYIMAMHRPRDMDGVREKILKECRRPSFAAVARYQKPIGKDKSRWPTGPSIRFAEAAVRCMTNITVETMTVYDDREKRIVRVTVTDLEANVPYAQDVTITKTIERRQAKQGDTVLRTRTNSYGDTVYILEATDDDIVNKQQALISKAVRTLGLRLIPGDIVDECMEEVVRVQQKTDAQDPDAARRHLLDSFGNIGIRVEQIKEYLGHDGGSLTPPELADLRALYSAIRDGETNWREVMDSRGAGTGADSRKTPSAPAPYPDVEFKELLPKWRTAIQAGKATADQVIARASTKGQLTDEQQAAIRAPIEAAPAQQQPDAEGVIEQPAMTYAKVADRLYKAGSMDQLADAGSCISLVQDADHRHGLADIYDQRAAQLEG